ncbi:nitroreductase family protein [Candidatus Sumerlaeota bacterium]|nr:nitroreductase family protein [Candidatus Sumerlaeota bacterium]
MDKPADTRYPIHDLLRHRWSPRAFDSRSVEPEKLGSILEAARWAPSSYNEQPWAFILATKDDKPEWERLLSCLVEANQAWAKTAPVLMISVAKREFSRNGKPNRHALHDVGLAVENLVIQATALDLQVHQMAGFSADRAREIFLIPEDWQPVAGLALGYQAGADSPAGAIRESKSAERVRKPLEDFVFTGSWNQASPIIAK